MPAYSEEEIIAGCRKKNRAFQEQLYKEHYSMFLKVCARYSRDMQDAEQMLNDSFLKIFNQVNSFKDTGSFQGWMRRIVVNTCVDHLRSHDHKKETAIVHVGNLPEENVTMQVNSEALENIEFKELLKMVQSLPAITRTVFNLYVFEGFKHEEIAGWLAITKGTSHWHLHQARSSLQQKIKKNDSLNVMYESKRI